ncbi:acyltransferase [Paramesorhizobium deserti]|uniref:Acyltransferase n=1 Tax=Paramesorhizobium deserti TaxID=1494590 RepID=A0A135HPJ3_9HYPH|nr:acyltransferase family protein [Paramesorhizobium deserti]KXF75125.1 acyltransferase [Paramesorhizobium deserti]
MSAIIAEPKSFRPDIEGLRALAVLGVIAFHFGVTDLPGGFVGVDVFFVISGYLITKHLLQEIDRRGTVDLLTFYARRARRLLPASIFVILVTLFAGYFILAPSEQQLYSKGALFASTYVINLWLIRWSLDYFAPDASNNPFIHFWSLSVEEQFYLVWPALLLLLVRVRADRRSLFIMMAGIAAISFAACAWLTDVSQPWAFYFSPFRAWEFALGGLAAMTLSESWAKRSAISPLLGWAGLALILGTYLTVSEEDPFPGFIALAPAMGTVMVLLSGMRESRVAPKNILAMAPFQWTGKLSYSLYLWHWPVIVYAAMLMPDMSIVQRLACLALTFVLSIISYHLVENPIRRNAWLVAGTGRSIGLAAILTVSGAALAYGNAKFAGRNFNPEQQLIATSAERSSSVRQTDESCVADLETVKPRPCVFGASMSDKTVVLFGDSHADHWSTPLIEIAKKEGFRLITYMKSSCRATRMTTYNIKLRRDYTECDDWREQAIKEIIAMKPQMVIVSQLSISHLDEEISDPSEYPLRKQQWAEGITSTAEELSDVGIDVVYLRDVPTHKSYIDKCVARALWQKREPSVCDTPRAEAMDDADAKTEREIIARVENARYVDMTDLFCSETTCQAMIDGKLTFRDRHHIATPYAASLAAPMERAVFENQMAHIQNGRTNAAKDRAVPMAR